MAYDVCIIGTGPAGLSAAINFKLHNKSVIWFGSKDMSLKVQKSEKIANYPGIPYVSGPELNAKFMAQAEEMGLEITDKMVTELPFFVELGHTEPSRLTPEQQEIRNTKDFFDRIEPSVLNFYTDYAI